MEIHHADKAYRKRSLWLLAGIASMCGVLLWQLQAWLHSLTSQLGASDPAHRAAWVRLLLGGAGLRPGDARDRPRTDACADWAMASRLQGRFPPGPMEDPARRTGAARRRSARVGATRRNGRRRCAGRWPDCYWLGRLGLVALRLLTPPPGRRTEQTRCPGKTARLFQVFDTEFVQRVLHQFARGVAQFLVVEGVADGRFDQTDMRAAVETRALEPVGVHGAPRPAAPLWRR